MHGYAHKSQTRERSDIPASVGREGVVPEGLIGRMDHSRQLAARLGRGLVKADGQRRPRCWRAVFLQWIGPGQEGGGVSKHRARESLHLVAKRRNREVKGVHAAAPGGGLVDAGPP